MDGPFRLKIFRETQDRCDICQTPTDETYLETDIPYCGKPSCGIKIQEMIDYHDQIGNR